MALTGTVKTPFGQVPKRQAVLIGGGIIALAVYVYVRGRKAKQAAAIAATGASEGTDPATGYLYGTPQDAAALANQASYVTPTGGGGGGGGSSTGLTNNGEWTQEAISYLTSNGLVHDPTQLSEALGKYITGGYVTSDEQQLIEQAIAVKGLPPVAGTGGFPPALNTQPPQTSGSDAPPPSTPLPSTPPVTQPTARTYKGRTVDPSAWQWINEAAGTISVGAGANLYAVAGSVGLDGLTFENLNGGQYGGIWKSNTRWSTTRDAQGNLTPYAIRGMPYNIG